MKNVVAYTRVSTQGQSTEDKYGREAQMKDIQTYADANDMNIVRWYHDTISGVKEDRPEFDRLLYCEQNPPVQAVIVAKSDRLARDINVYFYYKMLLKKNDIELISVAEDFGSFGVFAPMLESFVICVADMERKNINRRTSGGRQVKAAQGGYSGGHAPYGYYAMNGGLSINASQAPAVRLIFKLRKDGATMQTIADTLNKEGYVTRAGKPFKTSTVQTILANEPTYRGMYRYGKNVQWVQGQHEPILTDDTDGND